MEADSALLAACGIAGMQGLQELSRRCVGSRVALGQPTSRWSPKCLAVAIKLAVVARGWPSAAVVSAVLAVAADPATGSPARLAEAGPWWDQPTTAAAGEPDLDVDALELRLQDLGGRRLVVQAQARDELSATGLPLTRSTVTRRACQILDRQQAS